VGLCLGPYGGPRGDALSYAPGTPVPHGGRVGRVWGLGFGVSGDVPYRREGNRVPLGDFNSQREIDNFLPNNQRQRRTCYASCHLLYPVSAAHTSIFRMDSNSTSYILTPTIGGHWNWFCRKALLPLGSHQARRSLSLK
jgi:hypothetical protein